MTRAAIIVLNYNGLNVFGKKAFTVFLESLLKSITSDDVVLFVDNGSNDESVEFVKLMFKSYLMKGLLDVLELERNYGWSGGNNRGALYALRRYNPMFLVFVNNDVLFTYSWLNTLIDTVISNGLSIASPLVYEVGLKAFLLGDVVLSNGGVKPIIIYPKHLELLREYKYVRVPSVHGASMLVRSQLFRKLGGFNEEFKAYYDEVDFCYRALKKGVKIGVVTSSIVYHFGSLTVRYISGLIDKGIMYTIESSLYFMTKYYRIKGLIKSFLLGIESVLGYILNKDSSKVLGAVLGLVKGLSKALRVYIA